MTDRYQVAVHLLAEITGKTTAEVGEMIAGRIAGIPAPKRSARVMPTGEAGVWVARLDAVLVGIGLKPTGGLLPRELVKVRKHLNTYGLTDALRALDALVSAPPDQVANWGHLWRTADHHCREVNFARYLARADQPHNGRPGRPPQEMMR